MRRRSVRMLTARVLAASVALGGALLLSALPAGAGNDDPLQSGDTRATAHPDNITANKDGCAQAGLAGDVILENEHPSGTYFDLPDVPEGYTLTGVVVKGSNAYNVYAGSTSTTKLHAPINASGAPAGLSHWFACGTKESESSSEPPLDSSQPPTSDESPVESSDSGGATTSGGAVSGGGLAETGASVGSALWVAGGLLLVGGGLLVAARRRAYSDS